MRNSKAKTLKKTALFTLSLLLITAGMTMADETQTFEEFNAAVTAGNATLKNDLSVTTTLTPPVPSTITGNYDSSSKTFNTLTADSSLTGPVFKYVDASNATLENINIKDNNNTVYSGEGQNSGGGAIFNDNTNLTIKSNNGQKIEISGNKAVNGGAIVNVGTGTLNIENVNFSNNKSSEIETSHAGFGGAIYNTYRDPEGETPTAENYQVMTIKNSSFVGNEATHPSSGGYGGAIYHDIKKATITGTEFKNNIAKKDAGAIYNRAYMDINGNVTNYRNTNISPAVVSNINTVLNSNYDYAKDSDFAAIDYVLNPTTGKYDLIYDSMYDSVFEGNNAGANAGAIMNDGNSQKPSQDAYLTIEKTLFKDNAVISIGNGGGGALYNAPSHLHDSREGSTDTNPDTVHKITINQGTKFINNNVIKVTTDPVTNAKTYSVDGAGGAILNGGSGSQYTEQDAILQINGGSSYKDKVLFQNNIATNGGAINNRGVAEINNAIFRENGVVRSDNDKLPEGSMTSNGGAIYNMKNTQYAAASVKIENSSFINNRASSNGGAIYNVSKVTVIDSDFVGNGAGTTPTLANGGAIYTTVHNNSHDSTTTIIAKNKDVNIGDANSIANGTDSLVFHGRDNSSSGNANYIATGNFYASNGRTINVNSDVRGSRATDGSLLANINFGSNTETNYNGTVRFNGDASISSSNINIYSGTVAFAHDRSLDATNVLNMYGGTLDLLNGEYGAHQLQAREFNLRGDSTIRLDVDLANERMDGIFTSDIPVITNPGNNKLTIDQMYAWTDTPNKNAMVHFTDAPALTNNIVYYDEGKLVQSPTTKYAVTKYEITDRENPEENGVYFGFRKVGASDPAISGPVAAQAAYIMMDNIYRQSFANMDMVALMTPEQRAMIKALRGGNRIDWKREKGYVTGVFAPNTVPEERDGLYVRPFANFENVPLKNGPRVSNVFYGSLIGGESDLIDLGHGWDGTFSFFGAYHGSHQAYNGVDIWQNGGTFGAVGTAYKGRFFTGLTANVGASAAEARHGFGNDQFPILMTGAAWKSGYNLGMFSNKLILQPSYMMSYTFVNVFDYNSASGARISQDPLNAIEIIPGIRLIGNLKDGWQPYIGANMTWNIMDRTKFYANDVMLPQLSVKPFVEYGLGMQKRYGDRFTGFGQAMFRSGGRNGVAFTLGLRWALGN